MRSKGRVKGWLLDVYPTGKNKMVICLKEKSGKTQLFKDAYTPELYVHGSSRKLERLEKDLDENENVANWCYEKKKVRLRDSKESPAIRVECSSMGEIRDLAKSIARLGEYRDYELYNVDIPFPQDYLHKNGLFPLAKVKLENPLDLDFQLLDSPINTDYDLPPLKKGKIKIEPEKSGTSPKFGDPLGEIKLSIDGETTEIEGIDEREKILRLVSIIRERDPDIIITEGGDSWDLPYLARRAEANDISKRVILSRKPDILREGEMEGTSFFSYGQVYYKPPSHYLKGRIHIDTENSFIYGECGLQGLIELARITKTPLQKTARSSIGSAMTNLQLYWARKNNILIPWRKSEPEDFKTASTLLDSDRGGFIHEPKIGDRKSVV